MLKKICLITSLLLGLSNLTAKAQTESDVFRISTGTLTGVYYPVGGAICRRVNALDEPQVPRCRIIESDGGRTNLHAMELKEAELAIVQSDTLFQAFSGDEAMGREAMPQLRLLFSLYTEALTIMVPLESPVQSLGDLAGKAVYAGQDNTGTRETFLYLLEAHGVAASELGRLDTRSPTEAVSALCRGDLDAVATVSGHPSALLTEAANSCDIRLLALDQGVVSDLTARYPYYVDVSVPEGLYRGVDAATQSIGTRANVVAFEDFPEQWAYYVTEAVFGDWPAFETEHPALQRFGSTLRPAETAYGLVPLHPGAARYFREAGVPEQPECAIPICGTCGSACRRQECPIPTACPRRRAACPWRCRDDPRDAGHRT